MKTLVLLLFLAVTLGRLWLEMLNLRHLIRFGGQVPPGFEGAVDPVRLSRVLAYTLARSRLGMGESLVLSALMALFLFTGLFPLYDRWVVSLSGSFVCAGLLFALFPVLAQTLLHIPFSLVNTFGVEARFGFNRTSLGLWCLDLVKGLALSLVLLSLVLAGVLALIPWSPAHWWLWVWGFLALSTLFLMYLSPVLIEPLFFRFEPVGKPELEQGVGALMEKAGLKAQRVLKVDASKRSGHSNAYFTGIGRLKRIVLFDTLLEPLGYEEILAVLAHEVGHWKLGHVARRILLAQVQCLAGCFLAFALLSQESLCRVVGADSLSFYGRALVLLFLIRLILFPLTPLFAALSRRDERQADRYACDLTGHPAALASALVRLGSQNLSNLHPHPWYAWFYFSHPPLVERIRRLKSL